MKCHYCGTELAENAVFCRYCGTKIQPPQDDLPPADTPEQNEAAPATNPKEFPLPKAAPVFDEKTFSWEPPAEPWYTGTATKAPEPPSATTVITPPQGAQAPSIQLPTRRSLLKMILLGLITCGIYPIVIWSRLVTELNIAAARHDGRRTMPFFAMLLLSPLTLGIYTLVWFHELSNRIGSQLSRRALDYQFSAGDFWLWNFLLSLLMIAAGVGIWLWLGYLDVTVCVILCIGCLIGPYIYIAKLMKAMNLINNDFNHNG